VLPLGLLLLLLGLPLQLGGAVVFDGRAVEEVEVDRADAKKDEDQRADEDQRKALPESSGRLEFSNAL
jgi:hypothetical protein